MALRIVGAGAVGLTLAARLASAGKVVRLTTRRPEAAAALRDEGLRFEDAESGRERVVEVEAATWEERPDQGREGPFLLCTRAAAVEEVSRELAARSARAAVVTLQNGIGSEEVAARHLRRVWGGVWRETCTRLDDRSVRFLCGRPGRVVLGVHPEGSDPQLARLAATLEEAGLSVGISTRIAEDKWLKLCVNLMSAPNALVRREDHRDEAFVEVKARLLEEAREVLAAAGVVAASCDGADRSLDEEIAHQRAALRAGTSARPIALYNQVWASLRRGGPLEAADYHRRILDLAARHGCRAPTNARVLAALEAVAREGRGPECLHASELLPEP